MKILICAYRDWAKTVFNDLKAHCHGHKIQLVETPQALLERANEDWDFVAVIGWSWLVPSDIINRHLVVGMHPSDLPNFAGGSPIQNQILAGIEDSKATLFKLNEKFDEGEIIDKEPINLRGHLKDVLFSISYATTTLMIRFVRGFHKATFTKQEGEKNTVRRLKPEHSQISNPLNATCKEMWNAIRCREDPYPNAYFEDETGRLTIKWVEFEPK